MVDTAEMDALAIMTRAPSSGGKSRLFAALGCEPDPELLTALLLDTVDNASMPGVTRVIAVTPVSACEEVAALVPRDVQVIPQREEGSLGERMKAVMRASFSAGARAVALIGSDLPLITSAHLQATFSALARDPDALVLGPAADGGYYLIAASEVPDVFTHIEWGTDRVLAQTRDAARLAGLRVQLLDVLGDVDTPEALRECANPLVAPRTSAWLRRYEKRRQISRNLPADYG